VYIGSYTIRMCVLYCFHFFQIVHFNAIDRFQSIKFLIRKTMQETNKQTVEKKKLII
jgi:hypothetical protein